MPGPSRWLVSGMLDREREGEHGSALRTTTADVRVVVGLLLGGGVLTSDYPESQDVIGCVTNRLYVIN